MKNSNIRDLFPDLTEEELAVAEETLDRYLALIVRIAERIIEEKGYDEFVRMLEHAQTDVMPVEGSKS